MQQTLSLTYNTQLIHQAMGAFWWRVVGFRFLAALVLTATGLGILVHQGDTSWRIGVLASVVSLGIGLAIALYLIHYRNALHKLKAMGRPQATLDLSESSFSLSSGAGMATLPWSSIAEVWRFKTCWLLLFSKAQFVTLPLADLPPDAQAFILERVQAAGGKIG